jgi:ABC-2 type transport system ATP-binding protein
MLGHVAGEPVLELSGLTKRYGKVSALSGLNLRVSSGQVYGLLGRNGAGKSTALRIVMGITRADSGSVALFGTITKPGDVRARQAIGYVAQEQHFYDWMTPERLGRFVGAFYPSWDMPRFRELVLRFDVPARKVRTLSGGMKVKLGLALALAHHPRLLVLDEPTAGLDPVVRREFLEIVRDQAVAGQQATLFSSHLIDDLEFVADSVGIIESGRMLYEGSLRELGARVRRVVVPVITGLEPDPLPSLATGMPLKILDDRSVGGDRIVTFWADDPAIFAVLEQRLAGVPLVELPLEETFIALVRTQRAGAGGP